MRNESTRVGRVKDAYTHQASRGETYEHRPAHAWAPEGNERRSCPEPIDGMRVRTPLPQHKKYRGQGVRCAGRHRNSGHRGICGSRS